MEKNIALSIVLKIGEELKKVPGIKVVYTRDDDSFVDLFVRGEIANKAGADLFVSVHCDSHTSNAHGAGTFVLGLHANKQNFEIAKKENSVIYLEDNYEARYANYDINSPESVIGLTIMQEEFLDQSILLAKLIQDNFTGQLKRNDRKVKQAGFIVLHQTFMPSVLIETGFLTNRDEGRYLNSSKGQAEMGKAIAQAIIKYQKSIPDEETVISNGQLPLESTGKAEDPDLKQEEILELKKEPEAEVAKAEDTSSADTTTSKEAPAEIKEDKPKARQMVGKSGVLFKVQIMATAKDLPLNSPEFKGLNKISKEPIKNLFRYLYGETDTYMGAKLLKSNADMKGFTTSYIVAYKGGKRIALQDALKYEDE
ncbi:N-acetylmuramoyl-L-alanine amidase family protein [Muriicola soli]|uniref:N-acetylmuramoyl-L-alanine amidase family protein n=1 Tax=Muriicola soli TaxID=2507538 RepID=UPI0026869472